MTFLPQFLEGLRSAFGAVLQNKLRAVLTTLGIVIGIVMVTSTFTTINGIERAFDRSLALLGTNALYVQRTGFASPSEWWKFERRPDITYPQAVRLVETVNAGSRHMVGAAPVTGRGASLKAGDRALNGVVVRASTPDILRVANVQLDEGTFYTEDDVRTARPVAVIGQDVRDALFPAGSPIGKPLRISGQRYTVIGVLSKQGKFMGLESFDRQVQVPYGAFLRQFGDNGASVQARAASSAQMLAAEDELIGLMRVVRGLDAREEDNFSVVRIDVLRELVAATKATIYGIGLFLTALALLVGGIGVMNIMFVSVKERTREIGIRKALGAPRRAILLQFLLEAIVVCLLGGVVGVVLAVGVTALINQVFTAVLSPGIVVLAFVLCLLTGLVFGIVPAWRAARASPIESLRYE